MLVVVVNIIMECIEDLALSMSPVPTVFWKRYVDDILMAVPADQVDGMLAHINSINHNIQFTSEREEGHVIPLLDVTILHNDDGSLSTKVYHMPTTRINTSSSLPTTPQPTNRLLFPPYSRELLPTVRVREERSYVKETLHQNGYPQYPESFLFPQHSPSRKDREEKDDPRSRISSVPIPYIQEAVTRILSDINIQVHMKPFRTLHF